MSLEKVIANLKKGKVAPCYLLYGEEGYLLTDALNRILDDLLPESDRDFGLFFIDGENADFDLLKDHLLAPSLLGGRKVVVVKNTAIFQSKDNLSELISKIKDQLDAHPEKAVKYFLAFLKLSGFAWEDMQGTGWQKITDEQWRAAVEGDSGDDRRQWLPRAVELCAGRGFKTDAGAADPALQFEELLEQGLPAGNCLILTAETADKRKKMFKVFEKIGIVLHFAATRTEAVSKETLKLEAQKLLSRYGKSLTPSAWAALGRKTGYQLWPSLNELQKLIDYAGERAAIDERDVDVVVGKTKEDSVFDLTNALSDKNAAAALSALKALLDQGEHPLMILTMISREIRFLLQASILLNSGRIPRINPNMDFAWFQKNIYTAATQLIPEKSKKEDLLLNKHPYVIYNALRNGGRFSHNDLITYLDDLLQIDRLLKSSTTDPQILLESFLLKACNPLIR